MSAFSSTYALKSTLSHKLDTVDRRDGIDGWKRYERAGIVVIDQTTGKPHPL